MVIRRLTRRPGLFHPRCRYALGGVFDIDAEIRRLEVETGRLDFPKGVGARVNPDLIRQKYRPEEILKTIAATDWANTKALKREWNKHGDDWAKEGVALSLAEFHGLQEVLLDQAKRDLAGIYYFLHKHRSQLAVYGDVRFKGKLLRDTALMYDIGKNERVGFYRWSLSEMERQPEFVEIRGKRK